MMCVNDYAGKVIRNVGLDHVDVKMRGLRQQGLLTHLGKTIGEGYFHVDSGAMGLE